MNTYNARLDSMNSLVIKAIHSLAQDPLLKTMTQSDITQSFITNYLQQQLGGVLCSQQQIIIKNLSSKVEDDQKVIKELQQKVIELQKDVDMTLSLASQYQKYKETFLNLQEENNNNLKTIEIIQKQKFIINADLHKQTDKTTLLQRQNKELHHTLGNLRITLNRSDMELRESIQNNQQLKDRKSTLENTMKQLYRQIEKMKIKLNGTQQRLQQARLNLFERDKQCSKMQQLIEDSKHQKLVVEQSYFQLKKRSTQKQKQLKIEITEIKQSIGSLQQQYQQKDQEKKKQLKIFQKNNKEIIQQIANLQKQHQIQIRQFQNTIEEQRRIMKQDLNRQQKIKKEERQTFELKIQTLNKKIASLIEAKNSLQQFSKHQKQSFEDQLHMEIRKGQQKRIGQLQKLKIKNDQQKKSLTVQFEQALSQMISKEEFNSSKQKYEKNINHLKQQIKYFEEQIKSINQAIGQDKDLQNGKIEDILDQKNTLQQQYFTLENTIAKAEIRTQNLLKELDTKTNLCIQFETKILDMEKQDYKLKTQIKQLESLAKAKQLQEQKDQIKAKNNETLISDLRREISSKQSKVQNIQVDIAKKEQIIKQLEQKVRGVELQNCQVENKLKQMCMKIQKKQVQQVNMKRSVQQANNQYQCHLQQLKQQNSRDINNITQQLEEKISSEKKLLKKITLLQEQVTNLTNQIQIKQQRIRQASSQGKKFYKNNASLQQQLSIFEHQIQILKQNYQLCQKKLAQSQKKHERFKDKIASCFAKVQLITKNRMQKVKNFLFSLRTDFERVIMMYLSQIGNFGYAIVHKSLRLIRQNQNYDYVQRENLKLLCEQKINLIKQQQMMQCKESVDQMFQQYQLQLHEYQKELHTSKQITDQLSNELSKLKCAFDCLHQQREDLLIKVKKLQFELDQVENINQNQKKRIYRTGSQDRMHTHLPRFSRDVHSNNSMQQTLCSPQVNYKRVDLQNGIDELQQQIDSLLIKRNKFKKKRMQQGLI